MSSGENKLKCSTVDNSSMLRESTWDAPSAVANLAIVAAASAFAILAFSLFALSTTLILPGFFIGTPAFQAMGIIACLGAVCLTIALGLCLRAIVAWWCGLLASLAISLFAMWLLSVQGPAEATYSQWVAGAFLAVFAALLCVRRRFIGTLFDSGEPVVIR